MRTGQVFGSLLIRDKFIFYLETEKEKTLSLSLEER